MTGLSLYQQARGVFFNPLRTRFTPGTRVPVWWRDPEGSYPESIVVGWVCKERRMNKGRGCWRYVGYRDRACKHELPDSICTDRMATARAVFYVWAEAVARNKARKTTEGSSQ